MTIFITRYTSNGINVYNYDYDYDHMFLFYTKREIEKKVREVGMQEHVRKHLPRREIGGENEVQTEQV